MRIAVVDDHRDSAELLAAVLEQHGEYEVHVFFDGASALAALPALHADAAILDFELPDMSGQALARELHARPDCVALALIALSGSSDIAEGVESLDGDFRVELLKPVNIAALRRALEACRAPAPPRRRPRATGALSR